MGRRDGELGSCRLQPASSLQYSTRTCTVLYCTVDPMPSAGVKILFLLGWMDVPVVVARSRQVVVLL